MQSANSSFNLLVLILQTKAEGRSNRRVDCNFTQFHPCQNKKILPKTGGLESILGKAEREPKNFYLPFYPLPFYQA
ncbi:hypothetical protein BV372_07885 [Nostoc sp. T09]|nr:hypothetical protein BV372_07885 [Nostoc sp. T09]